MNPCDIQNLRIKRGTTLLCEGKVTDADGEAVDLTSGYAVKMQCREGYGLPVIFEASSEGGTPEITLSDDGTVTISVLVPETAPVTDCAVYDIIMTSDDGSFAMAEGKVQITDKATALE